MPKIFAALLFALLFALPAAAQEFAPPTETPLVEIAFVGILIVLGLAVVFLGISNPPEFLAIAKKRAEDTQTPWDDFAVQLGEIIAKAVAQAISAAKDATAKPPTPPAE